jgi:hypothetical protein
VSIGGIVLTVLVALPVIVGVIAGAVSSTSNQPTTYSWRPAYQPTVVANDVHHEVHDEHMQDHYDALDLVAAEESFSDNKEIHYETSIPNEHMEAGIDDLLQAISPTEPTLEVNTLLEDSLVFDEIPHNIDETSYEATNEIFTKFYSENYNQEESHTSEFTDAPSPLETKDYQAILQAYGPTVVSQITTTPAKGMTSLLGDVMIGRLEQNTVGTMLYYGEHYVLLTGKIRDRLLGKPVLIGGQFTSPEQFYVTYMTDPTLVGNSSLPFYDELPDQMIC